MNLPVPASPAPDDPRIAELRRMRLVATALLVAMAVIFVLARIFEAQWPWLAYVGAFAEASMVGACADWFAVVALFRHPLGVPIPHTAIVPRNKARIADAIGGFISKNFLEPAIVASRLASVDAVDWWSRQLSQPETAASLAQRAVEILVPFIELSERPEVHGYLREATRRGLLAVPAAPLAGRVLALLLEGGQLMQIAERIIAFGDVALTRNSDTLRAKVTENSSWWIPRWVDGKLADRVLTGARGSLSEMRAPDHPWRKQFADYMRTLIERLNHDADTHETGERLKAQIFENPTVVEWLDLLWRQIQAKVKEDIARDSGFVQTQIEAVLVSTARMLGEDPLVRDSINGWIRQTIEVVVIPHRDEIGKFISDVVKRWDNGTLVGKMEVTFGKDLQYIRINGTLVGGLVGLAIHIVTVLATSVSH